MEFNEKETKRYRAAVERYQMTCNRVTAGYQTVLEARQKQKEEFSKILIPSPDIKDWKHTDADDVASQIGALSAVFKQQSEALKDQEEALRAVNQILYEFRERVLAAEEPPTKADPDEAST